jgi:hypothetical protein
MDSRAGDVGAIRLRRRAQDLAGPGVSVQRLPAAYRYHYRYLGLRLLLMQSGTYYLLPVDWTPQYDLTYTLDQSDPIRIELLGAQP